MADYIDFPGSTGVYRYWFLTSREASQIQAVPGNYMFVKPTDTGWVPIYIGQAEDLSARISAHERWRDAVARGASRVIAHTNKAGESARLREERDLIQKWSPVCNTQFVPS